MVSHSYQNHAQFKRGCSASIHIKECLQCRRLTEHFQKLDHNHEQLNDKIKGVGGAIRLTENDSSLQRGLVADPETARLIKIWIFYWSPPTRKWCPRASWFEWSISSIKFFSTVLQLNKVFEEIVNSLGIQSYTKSWIKYSIILFYFHISPSLVRLGMVSLTYSLHMKIKQHQHHCQKMGH